MQIPPITRSLGAAERAMRALLERELASRNISFPEWTVLVFTAPGPLDPAEITRRQLAGHVITTAASSNAAVDRLFTAGLLSQNDDERLKHTESGARVFSELSGRVESITKSVFGHISPSDIEITHRTLLEICSRANSILTEE